MRNTNTGRIPKRKLEFTSKPSQRKAKPDQEGAAGEIYLMAQSFESFIYEFFKAVEGHRK